MLLLQNVSKPDVTMNRHQEVAIVICINHTQKAAPVSPDIPGTKEHQVAQGALRVEAVHRVNLPGQMEIPRTEVIHP